MEPPVVDPPPPPPPEPPELACPRCGAPHDRYQEYCLHCGVHLARYYPVGRRTAWSRETWSRESPFWLWAALAALALVALIASAIVLAATNDDEPRRQANRPGTTSTLQIISDITTSSTVGTLPPTLTIQPTTTINPTTTTTTTTATTTTGPTDTIIAWPSGKDGYTVVIASYPKSGGRSRAETKAREAINKGLSEVGILDSSNYPSLTPGYYVVFSGVHDTEAQARNALPSVRTAGYPTAYVREVSSP